MKNVKKGVWMFAAAVVLAVALNWPAAATALRTLALTALSVTGTTNGPVLVSSSTTSGASIGLAGAFQTLPTTGYVKGQLAYQLSDNTLYVATETVTKSQSWKATY